jgi:hypothetical protein
MCEDGARGSWPSDQLLLQWGAWKLGGLVCLLFSLVLLSFLSLSLIKSSCHVYIVEAQVKRASEKDEPVGWR